MPQELNNIKYIIGNYKVLSKISEAPVFPLFSDRVLSFLNDLSILLMNNPEAKKMPDVIAFAFWIRKASMEKEKIKFKSDIHRIGRGVIFHITPSNIPVQFAVSLVYALVSGNASVIKLSDKDFLQVNILCSAIQTLLNNEYKDFIPLICIVRFGHIDEITQKISSICDARLIWGGDSTIDAIRKIQAPPRCLDIGFSDRYSLTVIDSDYYLNTANITILANDFYNDTYFSDQNACSSPRIVIWIGNNIEKAKELFWSSVNTIVQKKYNMDPICGSDKLLNTAICAAKYPGIKQEKNDNMLVRVKLPKIYDDIMNHKGNSGYFFEYNTKNLNEILPLLKKECQTITYIGNLEDELKKLIDENYVRGVDRIVPVGHGADISFVWDGIELPFVLSRCISNT